MIWGALQFSSGTLGAEMFIGRTALLITTDHGRGLTGKDWTSHGTNIDGAEFIWMAVMGPGVEPFGIRSDIQITQSQVAATISRLVGENFQQVSPQIAAPVSLNKPAP